MGFNLDSYLTNADHSNIDHSPIEGVGDLHTNNSGPAGTIDHSALSHALIAGVGNLHNDGTGPSGTVNHSNLNHSNIPGVGFNQVSTHTFDWSASSTARSTGPLGFTPAYAIAIGVFNHSLLSTTVSTAASTMTIGVATGTGSNASSVGQMADRTGSADTMCTTYDTDSIAGISTHGDSGGVSVKTSWDLVDVDVTAFSSSGITLDPTASLTGFVILLVVGN